jgi:methylated-DNA-[protein]-cysteine S-methyltransferase
VAIFALQPRLHRALGAGPYALTVETGRFTRTTVFRRRDPTGGGRTDMTTRHTTIATPVGELTLVADGGRLAGVWFSGHRPAPDRAAFGPAVEGEADPLLTDAGRQIGEYLAGRRTAFAIPTATSGRDPFHERVWALLREIPHGRTTSYGELAARLGGRSLARRVGGAVARNPLSIVIPCHRVLGWDGALTGYAGGLERKRFLLDLERDAREVAAR